MRSWINTLEQKIKKLKGWIGFKLGDYRPNLLTSLDEPTLISQAAVFFNIPIQKVQKDFQTYHKFHIEKGYEKTLGEGRTLSFEEAFVTYLAMDRVRPTNIVEIGTQYGKSTRRIVDILQFLNIPGRVTCFDILDELRYVTHEEVHLIIHDVTRDFKARVLMDLKPGLIFLDAHPYHLIRNVVMEFIEWSSFHQSVLLIHDCSPGLYNPGMRVSKDNPGAINSRTGVWERHVLSEIFSVPNHQLDDLQTPFQRLRIFATRHGLAAVAPSSLFSL